MKFKSRIQTLPRGELISISVTFLQNHCYYATNNSSHLIHHTLTNPPPSSLPPKIPLRVLFRTSLTLHPLQIPSKSSHPIHIHIHHPVPPRPRNAPHPTTPPQPPKQSSPARHGVGVRPVASPWHLSDTVSKIQGFKHDF